MRGGLPADLPRVAVGLALGVDLARHLQNQPDSLAGCHLVDIGETDDLPGRDLDAEGLAADGRGSDVRSAAGLRVDGSERSCRVCPT
jgi:hypothetical protein